MISETFRQQHAQATEDAGLIALPHWDSVRVTGGDRASFLQNMCTNDIRGLQPGGGCEAFFTDVKGKIVAHVFALVGNEDILLLLAAGQAERLIGHLDRYIIREDLQLADHSPTIEWTLILGQQLHAPIDQLASSPLPDLAAPWSHAYATLGHVKPIDGLVVQCPLPWCGGRLLGLPRDVAAECQPRLVDAGAVRCAEEVWHAVRIESAWPLLGVDFDGSNLPQEVGRDRLAINFRKGCYLGQETIARIDALGHVNKRLAMIKLSGRETPAVGAELLAGEKSSVGRVTSACFSPRFGAPLAIAMVRRGHHEPGSTLSCSNHPAEVIELPRDS